MMVSCSECVQVSSGFAIELDHPGSMLAVEDDVDACFDNGFTSRSRGDSAYCTAHREMPTASNANSLV